MSTPTIPPPVVPNYPGELPPQPPQPPAGGGIDLLAIAQSWFRNLSTKARIILALGVAVLLLMIGGIAASVGRSSSGGDTTASAIAVVQADGYTASSQDETGSVEPSFKGLIITAAEGLDSNGDGEMVWVLSPSTDASGFEADALAEAQTNMPDATATLNGNVLRINIPSEDTPNMLSGP